MIKIKFYKKIPYYDSCWQKLREGTFSNFSHNTANDIIVSVGLLFSSLSIDIK